MSNHSLKNYWKTPPGLDSATPDGEVVKGEVAEILESAPEGFNRRSFLKAAGFTLAAGAATGCTRPPSNKLLPFLHQPEGRIAGRPLFYASLCGACETGCGVLVKSRDGRPIKLEGNPDHPVSKGGLCAIGQASLLGLYDSKRFQGPQVDGSPSTWEKADKAIIAKIDQVRSSGKPVRFLTSTVNSPTRQAVIDRFLKTFSDGRHIVYDPLSNSSILDAHQITHGARLLPQYHFEKAKVILAFDADFLGTWIDPVGFSKGYRAGRDLEGEHPHLSYHVQIESRMSLTGTKADIRHRVAPSELVDVVSAVLSRVARKAGADVGAQEPENLPISESEVEDLVDRLWNARGQSLIVSGSHDLWVQAACNTLNQLLGNYGKTVDIEHPSFQRQGDDRAIAELVQQVQKGEIGALFIADVNPVHDIPEIAAVTKAPDLIVSFARRPDETSSKAGFICPDPHPFETWLDSEPVSGVVALGQPTITPLRDSRDLIESLNAWMGTPQSADRIIQGHWEQAVYPRTDGKIPFGDFWNRTLQQGFAKVAPRPSTAGPFNVAAFRSVPRPVSDSSQEGFTLVLYPKVGLTDGRHAYNPWLQELPDPVTKVTWDNYACLSVATSKRLGVSEGDVVRIKTREAAVELPVYVQPGQHDDVVAVAVGYGQEMSRRFADIGPHWVEARPSVGEDGLVGKSLSSFVSHKNTPFARERNGVEVIKTEKRLELASTQTHHTITVPKELEPPSGGLRRPILQETTLPAFLKDPSSGSLHHHHQETDLYPDDHPYAGHHWGMVIDPSACTGCSACVIACHVENNVPVVGKDEVRRRREMHWMRIDRYYSGDGDDVDVAHQPMLCQQCDNASCENVCPVLATVHTSEGLNAQVYNRCVGTRYCANNCAYKVRRFNWFTYRHDDELENMVLNPDVTIRIRGVMEKCSFCVQRLQDAKIEAKRKGEKVTDDAVQPACQQSCPSNAIVLGDMNDPESRISKLLKSPRYYRVLEEVNTKPSVGYLTLVRNRSGEDTPAGDHHKQEGHHDA